MMKLKFDSKLDFQLDAINSVIDLFKGQIKQPSNYSFQIVPNILNLSKEKILENLKFSDEELNEIDEIVK